MAKKRSKRRSKAGSRAVGSSPARTRAGKHGGRSDRARRPELPLWKKLLFSLLAVGLFFGGIEALLAAWGVEPVLYDDDPYVGFASSVPHFVAGTLPDGSPVMTTASNKLRLFNAQAFARLKREGTARVFCLGGSTTYGRPYGDATSFCGWLRELLPVADPSRSWEVVNAGGISYASYRVALLMEELLAYEPDLFIVYTGHNEFLERRTYGGILATPRAVRGLGALASRTRLFTAAQQALFPKAMAEPKTTLDDEVRTLLDASVGPSEYYRDDALHEQVLEHFQFSLARMVDMARSGGADVVLVTPASNLRHCAPFKSESSELDGAQAARWQALIEQADAAEHAGSWEAAASAVEAALALDDRHAGTHYQHGRVLDALGRFSEAKTAFARARDEDVCPLRALGPMPGIVEDVATERGVPWVDFAGLIEARAAQGIPGDDFFLDHVHPTIEGHRMLALELIEALSQEGVLRLAPGWNEAAIARVVEEVEGRLDPQDHGMALSQLSRVLGWAGKLDEARKLSVQAAELAPDLPTVQHQAALSAHLTEDLDTAIRLYRRALQLDPSIATAHSNLAVILDEAGQDETAAEHYRQAISLLSDKNAAYRARLQQALAELEAKR
ncbi:MAG: tetratricopeptide repeat protein [Acidobacteriota bacterium]